MAEGEGQHWAEPPDSPTSPSQRAEVLRAPAGCALPFPLPGLPCEAAALWDLYLVPTPQEMADSLPRGLLVALPENQSLMSLCSTPPPQAVQTQK